LILRWAVWEAEVTIEFRVVGRERVSDDKRAPQLARVHDVPGTRLFVNVRKTDGNRTLLYLGDGSPEAAAPISVSSVNGSNLPLNSGLNAAPVYGHRTLGDPL
jgi:hypothetical protein